MPTRYERGLTLQFAENCAKLKNVRVGQALPMFLGEVLALVVAFYMKTYLTWRLHRLLKKLDKEGITVAIVLPGQEAPLDIGEWARGK